MKFKVNNYYWIPDHCRAFKVLALTHTRLGDDYLHVKYFSDSISATFNFLGKDSESGRQAKLLSKLAIAYYGINL